MLTAVRASISTPVLPVVFASAVMRTALASVSRSKSTAMRLRGSGMAEGYEVGGLLGTHDARDAGYGEDVALVEGVVSD